MDLTCTDIAPSAKIKCIELWPHVTTPHQAPASRRDCVFGKKLKKEREEREEEKGKMSTEEESREAASGGDHTNPPAVAGKEDAAGSGEHHEQGEGREAAGAEGEEAETADTGAKDDGAAPEDGEGTEGAEDAVGAEDAEAGEGGEVEKEPEDPVFALRDKLIRILDDTSPDLTQARDILDALMEKWDNIDVPQIVLPGKESLGMIVRRLRKHEDEELATRAGRLYGMYQTE